MLIFTILNRDIERLLLSAPKQEKEMSERERGLLIVGVNGMRTWAAGLGGSKRGVSLSMNLDGDRTECCLRHSWRTCGWWKIPFCRGGSS